MLEVSIQLHDSCTTLMVWHRQKQYLTGRYLSRPLLFRILVQVFPFLYDCGFGKERQDQVFDRLSHEYQNLTLQTDLLYSLWSSSRKALTNRWYPALSDTVR